MFLKHRTVPFWIGCFSNKVCWLSVWTYDNLGSNFFVDVRALRDAMWRLDESESHHSTKDLQWKLCYNAISGELFQQKILLFGIFSKIRPNLRFVRVKMQFAFWDLAETFLRNANILKSRTWHKWIFINTFIPLLDISSGPRRS